MLYELDHPAFVEVIEKAADVSVQNAVHLLLQKRIRQRIQRVMLAAPRAEAIREAQKVFLVNLVEDGPRPVGRSCLPGPRPPMDVAVHLLSVCTLSSRAALGTLHDEPVREGRRADPPGRSHTPAT